MNKPAENHPWRYSVLKKPRKTEEDVALERFEDVDDRLDRQLEQIAERYSTDNTY